MSNADYARLAVGQPMRYIHRVAGNDAQISWRRWSRGSLHHQERRYDMCTPTDRVHVTLTTRFQHYDGAWRAYPADTRVGPEPDWASRMLRRTHPTRQDAAPGAGPLRPGAASCYIAGGGVNE